MKKFEKLEREKLIIALYQYDLMKKEDFEVEELKNIIEKLDEIDDIIVSNLTNYTINRLSFIDRAIIRLATYELRYKDLAVAIIIDEAVNYTKKYSDLDDEKQHKFTNRLLDNIAKDIRG